MDTNNNQPVTSSPPNPPAASSQPGTPSVPSSPTTSKPSPSATPTGQRPVDYPPPSLAPSGPPPLDTTIQPPSTAATLLTSHQTEASAPTQPSASEGTSNSHTDDPHSASGGKRGVSKALMAGVGVLIIGAFSAVFLVANMQTGDTQNYADTTQSTPMPTAVISPTVADANLTITSPINNSTVNTASTTVAGRTFPNADVSVNDAEIQADSSGNFSTTISLEEGENTIIITATNPEGKVAEQEITITYAME